MRNSTRVARFKAQSDMIAWALGMPEGTKISRIELIDPINMIYYIYAIHDDLKEVAHGGYVPEIYPVAIAKEEGKTPRDVIEWHWNQDGKYG